MSRTIEVDKVQELIDSLNTIAGIEFAEDAWEQNYGVRITIYVTGGSHKWIEKVEEKLDALQIPHTMPTREYLFDIKKVSWVWNARIRKKVTQTAEPEGEEDGEAGIQGI